MAATTDALAGAGLAHLACHGRLRSDNPSFSALELADGQLTVHELDRRGIAPTRVVLAACDSAADMTYVGDELLGFVSALLARGTRGVLASMVAVGDTESVDLMEQLHCGLAGGRSMPDALHAARAGLTPPTRVSSSTGVPSPPTGGLTRSGAGHERGFRHCISVDSRASVGVEAPTGAVMVGRDAELRRRGSR